MKTIKTALILFVLASVIVACGGSGVNDVEKGLIDMGLYTETFTVTKPAGLYFTTLPGTAVDLSESWKFAWNYEDREVTTILSKTRVSFVYSVSATEPTFVIKWNEYVSGGNTFSNDLFPDEKDSFNPNTAIDWYASYVEVTISHADYDEFVK